MEDKKLVYQAPEVVTYTNEEILEEIGPAYAQDDPLYNGGGQQTGQ